MKGKIVCVYIYVCCQYDDLLIFDENDNVMVIVYMYVASHEEEYSVLYW